MFHIYLYTFLFCISPLEARIGIPYAVFNNVHFFWAFLVGLIANAMVYPLLMGLINLFNNKFMRYRPYKRRVVWLSQKAKRSSKSKIEKYGFWGLMIFVMIPLPGTGAYMGTIAAAIFKIPHRSAFFAITIGLTISCFLVAIATYYGLLGIRSI